MEYFNSKVTKTVGDVGCEYRDSGCPLRKEFEKDSLSEEFGSGSWDVCKTPDHFYCWAKLDLKYPDGYKKVKEMLQGITPME